MNNQDFGYFHWGTHENTHLPFYALATPSVSRFYIAGEDYQKLKLMQFITMSSRPTVMVKLSAMPNYSNGLIDNSVCLGWRVNSPLGSYSSSGLAGDYKPRGIDRLSETSVPTFEDLELQKNLFFISKLLDDTDSFIDRQLELHVDRQHTTEMLNYFKITLPNDIQLHSMIEQDHSNMQQLETTIRECKNILIRLLSLLDYTASHSQVCAELTATIDSTAFSLTDSHLTYKQYILDRL
jgi:hypothetical protein